MNRKRRRGSAVLETVILFGVFGLLYSSIFAHWAVIGANGSTQGMTYVNTLHEELPG